MLIKKIAQRWKEVLAAGTMLSSLESYAQTPWEAKLSITATNTSLSYQYENRFGAKTNATRNFNFGIDILAPPPQPSGINTYQRTDDNVAVLRNYINTTDENLSFRGVIQYNNFTPTSVSLLFNNLTPAEWNLLTFSDTAHAQFVNAYSVTNSQQIPIGTNVRSYIVTKKPRLTSIAAQQNVTGATEITLSTLFHCYDAVKLEVQGTPALPGAFSALGNISLINGNGSFATQIPLPSHFFRARPVQK